MSAALLAIVIAALAQPAAPADQAPSSPAATVLLGVPNLGQRLEALDPADAGAYYELGEEVAGEAVEKEHVALARQLYVLAYELDRVRGARSTLGPSVCLALAKIERLEEVQGWLRATAGTLDPRYVSTDWNVPAGARPSDQTALKAAEVLGLTRSGEGTMAMARMEQPGVRELLLRYEPLLSESGRGGGLPRLETQMRAWPCPECKNRRAVTRMARDGPEVQVCSTCNGDPGPELLQEELVAHLRFESRLLTGLQRSWSAQAASDFGAPLLDPDPAQLAETLRERYGLVLGRPFWRQGQWTAGPDGPPPEPFGPPEPEPAQAPEDVDAPGTDKSSG